MMYIYIIIYIYNNIYNYIYNILPQKLYIKSCQTLDHRSGRVANEPGVTCWGEGISVRPGVPERTRNVHVGLSENVGYIPNEIAIFHRDKGIMKTIGFRGVPYFQTKPCTCTCNQ